MKQFHECQNTREIIKYKLHKAFDGKIVPKDLTKKIKEGANVPVYALEFLRGQYCSSYDNEIIERGVKILADNFVYFQDLVNSSHHFRSEGILDNFC